MTPQIRIALEQFAQENKFSGKGALCVALVVTETAKTKEFPLNSADFLAASGTQVSGLGVSAVQTILARHSINKILAKEGGRTSRGSVPNMLSYLHLLNTLNTDGTLNLNEVESFWIKRVEAFFAGKPFTLRLDSQIGLRAVIRNLIQQATERQKQETGTMFLGTVMQHLVGAKLEVVLGPNAKIDHHNSNQNDQKIGRTGDFDIGDVSIHVSSSPSELLISKCRDNLAAGLRPIIISGAKGAIVAEGLASNIDIADRVDIIEFEQFMATNFYELGRFVQSTRRIKIEEIIESYNKIIDHHETDPSLRIEIGGSR